MSEIGGRQPSGSRESTASLSVPPNSRIPTPELTATPPETAESRLTARREATKEQADTLLDKLRELEDALSAIQPENEPQAKRKQQAQELITDHSNFLERLTPSLERADAAKLDQIDEELARIRRDLNEIDRIGLAAGTGPTDDRTERTERDDLESLDENETVDGADEARDRRIGRTLGCLTTEASMVADGDLSARVQEALERMGHRNYELHPDLVQAVAEQIMEGWDDTQRATYKGRGRQLLNEQVAYMTGPDATDGRRQRFDALIRKTCVQYLINLRTQEIRQQLNDHIGRLQEQKPQSRAGSFLAKAARVGGVGVGVALGSWIRDSLLHLGIPAAASLVGSVGAVNAARLLSGGSSLAAGAAVGGLVGGVTGYMRARDESFGASNIRQEINKLQEQLGGDQLTPEEEAKLLVRLMDEKKLRGTPDEVQKQLQDIRDGIDRYYQFETQRELETALALVENNESANNFSHEQNLARALTGLLQTRTNGSVRNRGELYDQFIIQRQKAVWKEAGWSALRGAVKGAIPSGLIGLALPAASLIAKVNVEHAVQEFQAAGKAGLEPLFDALRENAKDRARDLAGKLNIDLGQSYSGQSLYEAAHDVVTGVKDQENAVRALHHVLSHPGATVGHLDSVISLANQTDGRTFSDLVLRGWPGGTNGNEVVTSLHSYFQKHGQWPIGSEQGWAHLAGFALAAWQAGGLSRMGEAGIRLINEETAKAKGELIESKERKEIEYDPGSRRYRFDKRIFNLDGYKNDNPELYTTLRERLAEFKRVIPGHHGYFVIVPDGEGHKVYRLWPYNNHRARQGKAASIHEPRDNNIVGDTGQPDLDLLGSGTVMVKEYKLEDLVGRPGSDGTFPTHPHERQLKESWDVPQWHTPRQRLSVSIDKLFLKDGEFILQQALISPLDIEKYAYAIKNGLIEPGEYVTNITSHIRTKLEESGGKLPAKEPAQPKPDKPGADTESELEEETEETNNAADTDDTDTEGNETDTGEAETKDEAGDTTTEADGEETETDSETEGKGATAETEAGDESDKPEAEPKAEEQRQRLTVTFSGPFDPESELRQILSETKNRPIADRRARIEAYREKLAQQKEGLAELHQTLTQTLRDHPDMTLDDLKQLIEDRGAGFGITDKQRERFEKALSEYQKKRQAVSWLRGQYPDPADLYQALFGRKPHGTLNIVEGPMTLYFRLDDLRDVARIRNQNYLKTDDGQEDETTTSAQPIGAFAIGGSFNAKQIKKAHPGHEKIPAGVILIENTTYLKREFAARGYSDYEACSRNTLEHEEQHGIDTLLSDEVAATAARQEWQAASDPSGLGTTEEKEQKRLAIRHYLRYQRRKYIEPKLKDEILAMLRIDSSLFTPGFFKSVLTLPKDRDGQYDYPNRTGIAPRVKKALQERVGVDASYQPVIDEEVKRVLDVTSQEYTNLVTTSLRVCKDLEKGGYDLDRMIALLANEPLSQWPSLANRLVNKRGAPTPAAETPPPGA